MVWCFDFLQFCNEQLNHLKLKIMKTIKKLSLVITITVASILTSCSKSSPTPDPVAAVAGSFITTKINGVNYSSATSPLSSTIASKQGSGAGTIVSLLGTMTSNVSASGATTESVTINLLGVTAAGTYALNLANKDTAQLGYTYAPSPGTAVGYSTGDCSGTTGTLVITSFTATQIEGTFTCTAKKVSTCDVSKTITEGTFKGVFQ